MGNLQAIILNFLGDYYKIFRGFIITFNFVICIRLPNTYINYIYYIMDNDIMATKDCWPYSFKG